MIKGKFFKLLILLYSLSLAAFASGQSQPEIDHAALLEEAAGAIDENFESEWAFTETSISQDSVLVGRYNPNLPVAEQWTLVTYDGREPTTKEIEEYLSEKAAERGEIEEDKAGDNGDRKGVSEVSAMIKPGSLQLVEETESYWEFSFVPADDDDKEFFKAMTGTLRIVKNGRYLEVIDIHSTKPFKPEFGVKIKEFVTRLRFGPAVEGGPVVPLAVDFKIEAKAFLVKSIKETLAITYSEYEYVGR